MEVLWRGIVWCKIVMHASLLTLLTCGCQGSCANLEFKASPVLEFQKTEKSLNFFQKTSGRPWKVWNLSIVKVSTRLVTWWLCKLPATVAIKLVEELLNTILLMNVMHECFNSVFFSSTSRVVCYRMIDWKKSLELLNEKPWIFFRLLAQEPWIMKSRRYIYCKTL